MKKNVEWEIDVKIDILKHIFTIDVISQYIGSISLGLYDPSSNDCDIEINKTQKIFFSGFWAKVDSSRHEYLFYGPTIIKHNIDCYQSIWIKWAKASTIPLL